MTIRRFLIAIALLACSAAAFGQSARLPLARTAPEGVKVVPPGYNTMTQHMIPRYMGGVKQGANEHESYGPAGQLIGWGPHSVIQGNAETQNQAVKAVVFTEDYGAQNMSQWQGGTAGLPQGCVPAVLQAQVRDVTIIGHDENESNYATINGGVDMLLDGSDLYGGLFVRSSGHMIENVTVYHIPGTAVVSTRGNGTNRHGTIRPFDREKSIVRRCQVAWAYRGFDIQGNDSVVADLEGQALRDYGIKFTTGATQIAGALHFWGVGAGSNPKAAIYFPNGAGPCWGGPLYGESSNIGVLIESSANMLHDVYSHTCRTACVSIAATAQRNQIKGLYIDYPFQGSQPIGLLLAGQYTTIVGGQVNTPAKGKGIVISNGIGQRIRDVAITSLGGTCIDADATLNHCVIDVQVAGGTIGLDLNDSGTSRIGVRNTIIVRVPYTERHPATVVDLPTGWQKKTPKNTTNHVEINGQRWYPPDHEF